MSYSNDYNASSSSSSSGSSSTFVPASYVQDMGPYRSLSTPLPSDSVPPTVPNKPVDLTKRGGRPMKDLPTTPQRQGQWSGPQFENQNSQSYSAPVTSTTSTTSYSYTVPVDYNVSQEHSDWPRPPSESVNKVPLPPRPHGIAVGEPHPNTPLLHTADGVTASSGWIKTLRREGAVELVVEKKLRSKQSKKVAAAMKALYEQAQQDPRAPLILNLHGLELSNPKFKSKGDADRRALLVRIPATILDRVIALVLGKGDPMVLGKDGIPHESLHALRFLVAINIERKHVSDVTTLAGKCRKLQALELLCDSGMIGFDELEPVGLDRLTNVSVGTIHVKDLAFVVSKFNRATAVTVRLDSDPLYTRNGIRETFSKMGQNLLSKIKKQEPDLGPKIYIPDTVQSLTIQSMDVTICFQVCGRMFNYLRVDGACTVFPYKCPKVKKWIHILPGSATANHLAAALFNNKFRVKVLEEVPELEEWTTPLDRHTAVEVTAAIKSNDELVPGLTTLLIADYTGANATAINPQFWHERAQSLASTRRRVQQI